MSSWLCIIDMTRPISCDFLGYLIRLPLSWLSISTGQGAKLRDRIMTMLRKLRNEKHADCCFQARTQEFVGLTEILGGKYWSGDPYPTGVSSGTDRQILFQFCS